MGYDDLVRDDEKFFVEIEKAPNPWSPALKLLEEWATEINADYSIIKEQFDSYYETLSEIKHLTQGRKVLRSLMATLFWIRETYAPIDPISKCPNCENEQLEDDDLFCWNCGWQLIVAHIPEKRSINIDLSNNIKPGEFLTK